MFSIRPAHWPEDVSALSALDISFVTDRIYRLASDSLSFRLTEEAVAVPLRKSYPFEPSNAEEQANWDCTVVAENEGRVVGFAAAQYMVWNRRAVVWHLYVSPEARGRGVGTQLLNSIDAFA